MPTTVHLQGTVSYGVIVLWILFFILISPLIIRKVNKRKAAKAEKEAKKQPIKIKKIPPSVKERYVGHLNKVLADYKDGKIDNRNGYQLLSFYLRAFFKEYSGVDLTKKTLAEIRQTSTPVLESLIEEYYECEFAPDADGDLEQSVKKTINRINNF